MQNGDVAPPRFGVVLAAGRGTRMGGPKALLRVGEATLAEQHAQRLLDVGCRFVVVLVSPDVQAALVEAFAHRWLRQPATVHLVVADTQSPAETLAMAVTFVGANAPASFSEDDALAIVTPVDLLPPAAATIERLVEAVEHSRGALDAATPVFQDRGGHPVVVRWRVLRDVQGVHALPLRDHLRALGSRRARIVVTDANVTGDFDVPADLPADDRGRTMEEPCRPLSSVANQGIHHAPSSLPSRPNA